MVVGKTSQFIEGFENITVDDTLLLSNLQQSIKYTKSNMAVSDMNTNGPNSQNRPPPPQESQYSQNRPPPPQESQYYQPPPSQASQYMPPPSQASQYMPPPSQASQYMPPPSQASQYMPPPSPSPTGQKERFYAKTNSKPVASKSSVDIKGDLRVTKPGFTPGVDIKGDPRVTKPGVKPGVDIKGDPRVTKPGFTPGSTKGSTPGVKPGVDIKGDPGVTKPGVKPGVKPDVKPSVDIKGDPGVTKSNSKFTDIKNNSDDEEDEDDDEEEDEDEGFMDNNNHYDYQNKKLKSSTRRQRDIEEGFHGSQIIEARYLKNILLALLISFIGYIVAMSSAKNYLPISDFAPHMKKFKNLIYIGIFFVITYICLEVF